MLNQTYKNQLKLIARSSIDYGLEHNQPLPLDLLEYDPVLQELKATFVTLTYKNNLRGCIGILEPMRSLVEDVAYNAYAAAFRDHRFKPVTKDEAKDLEIHISILNTPESIQFESESDLISKIRPGVDGLILEEKNFKSTFLPSVWESLSNSRDFLNHLKLKAGLPENYWSHTLKVSRYTVDEF